MAGNGKRGFGSMSPEKQREIARKGGKAAHAKGTAHEFTPEEAREAGRKGGKAAHAKGTAHKFTSAEAVEAGRKGGSQSRGGQDNLAPVPKTPPPSHHEGGPSGNPEPMANSL
jgi:general stress protein YciG